MWSLPAFAGTVLGCFLFALLLSFIPGLRSQTTGRLLLINIISWVILAVGDNAARGTEDLGETLARVFVAQFVVCLLMLGWVTAKQKGAAEIKTQAQKKGAAEVETQAREPPRPQVGPMLARLGNVIYWTTSTLAVVAMLYFAMGLYNDVLAYPNVPIVDLIVGTVITTIITVVIWGLGRAARYVLAGR
jgi:hypothetical protein